MSTRALPLALGFAWLAYSAAADEASAPPPQKAATIAREAIKDFKFHPVPAVVSVEKSPVLKTAPPADAPVVMSPYVIRAQRDRTFQELTVAIAQHERLKSPALLHVGNIDVLLPPIIEVGPAGEPRLNLGVINLRF